MNNLDKTSSKIRPIKVKDLLYYLKNIYNIDLSLLRQKGSHRVYRSSLNGQNTIIPSDDNEHLNKYLLSRIFKQIGLNINPIELFDDINKKMHKKSQQEIHQLYGDLIEKGSQGIDIAGSGQNEVINIPGASKTITAKELLQQVINNIKPILISKRVRTIDTSPIANPNAQGLAKSNQAGTIFVDVKKIFENTKRSLPANAQLDGVTADPDIANSLVDKVSKYIEAELANTTAHEGLHNEDYIEAYQGGHEFSTVQEAPAEQFGQKIQRQFYPETFTASVRKQWIKIAQSKQWQFSDWKEMIAKAFDLLDSGYGKFVYAGEVDNGVIYKLTQSEYHKLNIYTQIKISQKNTFINTNVRVIKKRPELKVKEYNFNLNLKELNKAPYLAIKKVNQLLGELLSYNTEDDSIEDNWFNKLSQSHILNPTERGIEVAKDGKYILYYSSADTNSLHRMKTLPAGTILTAHPDASKRVGNNVLDDNSKTLKIKVDRDSLILGNKIFTKEEVPLDILN
jgi:predicted RNA binding protein YcfA (HicA-like mRNA interferase family)